MQSVPWEEEHDTVSVDRIFEHTEKLLKVKFTTDNGPDLDALMKYPCLLMQEGKGSQVARVCRITSARQVGSAVHFDYVYEGGMPILSNRDIYKASAAFGFDNDFEFGRTHWAVKNVDLYRAVLRAAHVTRSRPKVFKILDPETIEDDLLSVMMPFDGAYRPVYDNIITMAEKIGMRCQRGDDIWKDDAIIQDVVDLIDRSKIVICDCSGRNPNVFYEIGIAHTLGRSVILITQNNEDVPFDLRHIRYIKYLNNAEGRIGLCEKLRDRINTLVDA